MLNIKYGNMILKGFQIKKERVLGLHENNVTFDGKPLELPVEDIENTQEYKQLLEEIVSTSPYFVETVEGKKTISILIEGNPCVGENGVVSNTGILYLVFDEEMDRDAIFDILFREDSVDILQLVNVGINGYKICREEVRCIYLDSVNYAKIIGFNKV
jgi:hypothetical protein